MRGSVPLPKVCGAILLLVGLLASTLPAEAQGPGGTGHLLEIRMGHAGAPITPITGHATIPIEVKVRCDSPGVDPALQAHTLSYSIATDRAWAVVTLSRMTDHVRLDPRECAQGEERLFRVDAEVSLSKDAPAFTTTRLKFEARLDTGERAVAETTVRAGSYENWQARLERSLFEAPADTIVQVPLIIENFGNGPISVRVLVGEGTSESLAVAPPGPQTIDSLIAGGETNRVLVPIDVRLSSDTGQTDRLVLRLEAVSALDTSIRLPDLERTALFQTSGTGGSTDVGELPAPGALLLPLLAAALAFAARRRT